VLVGTDGRRGYLQHLAVALGFRGNTIGKQLVAQSVSALEGMGILKTHLFVHNDNAEAQEFYKSLGWYLRDDVQMYSFNNSDRDNV